MSYPALLLRHFQVIHLSVFCHMAAIVILAKTMFYT